MLTEQQKKERQRIYNRNYYVKNKKKWQSLTKEKRDKNANKYKATLARMGWIQTRVTVPGIYKQDILDYARSLREKFENEKTI